MPALELMPDPIAERITSEESPANGDGSKTIEDVELNVPADDINGEFAASLHDLT